jgi:hypothetical protein
LTQYRVIFPTLKGSGTMMQIAELKLYGTQSSSPAPTPPPAPLPEITLAVSPASIPEDGTSNLVYTFTRTGSTASPLSVNYNVAGTATLGTDYTGIAGTPATITFAAGSATASLTVDPTADAIVEADETVALTLAAGTGYTIGTVGAVVGTITNDDVVIPPGGWIYNWANASTLGNIPSILKASVAMPSPRAGEQPLALTALRVDLRAASTSAVSAAAACRLWRPSIRLPSTSTRPISFCRFPPTSADLLSAMVSWLAAPTTTPTPSNPPFSMTPLQEHAFRTWPAAFLLQRG